MAYKIESSVVGYGEIGVNETGSPDIAMKFNGKDSDKIFAHANSEITISVTEDYIIQGAINGDCNPVDFCNFFIDNTFIGILSRANEATRFYRINKGTHVLKITTGNNARAHTLWNIKKPESKKVAIVTIGTSQHNTCERVLLELSSQKIFFDNYNNTSDIANRLNTKVQEAIDSGYDIIGVIDNKLAITDNEIEYMSLLSDSYGMTIKSQCVNINNYKNGRFSTNNFVKSDNACIALTANDWIKFGGFTSNNKSIIDNIQELINVYCLDNIVCSCNKIYPLVIYPIQDKVPVSSGSNLITIVANSNNNNIYNNDVIKEAELKKNKTEETVEKTKTVKKTKRSSSKKGEKNEK